MTSPRNLCLGHSLEGLDKEGSDTDVEEQHDGYQVIRPRPLSWVLLSPGLLLGLLVGSCGSVLAIAPEAYPGNHVAGLVGLGIGVAVLMFVLPPLVNPLIQLRGGVLIKRNAIWFQQRWPANQLKWIQLDASHLGAVLPDGKLALRLNLYWWRRAELQRLAGSGRTSIGTSHKFGNELDLSEVPVTADVAGVLRSYSQRRSVLFGTGGVLAGIIAVAVGSSGALFPALLFAAITIGLFAATFFTLLYTQRDLVSGKLIRATGTIGLIDKVVYGGEWSSQRFCKLIVGELELSIKPQVADLLRTEAILAKHTDNIVYSQRDLFLFPGSVEYAPKSALALRVFDAGGRSVWQHPGLPVRSLDGLWVWDGTRWVPAGPASINEAPTNAAAWAGDVSANMLGGFSIATAVMGFIASGGGLSAGEIPEVGVGGGVIAMLLGGGGIISASVGKSRSRTYLAPSIGVVVGALVVIASMLISASVHRQ